MRYRNFSRRAMVLVMVIAMVLGVPACDIAPGLKSQTGGQSEQNNEKVDVSEGERTVTSTSTPSSTPNWVQPESSDTFHEATATSTPIPTPKAVNPFTGQSVEDPNSLCQRPLLVAISNFPISARPQAGLSVAAHVWETFIGEGMTRYLAVFYGDYIHYLEEIASQHEAQGSPTTMIIGPVRSGRVVFEDIKLIYERGRLITAGASSEVADQLTNRSSVYGSDPNDINSAGVGVDDIVGEPGCPIDPTKYASLVFNLTPPSGGEDAGFLRIVYNVFNQVGWEYDAETGAHLRSQDLADGTGELVPTIDRLTGEQLAFQNVVILWVEHRYVSKTIIEMELAYVQNRKGLLLRDGKVFEIRWSSRAGKLTLQDGNGLPIPLKPGKTFFEVVSWQTTWDPVSKIVRYHNPPIK